MPTIPNALVPIFFCWHHPCSQISRFQGVATTTLYFRCRLCTKSLSRYQFMKFFVVSSNLKKSVDHANGSDVLGWSSRFSRKKSEQILGLSILRLLDALGDRFLATPIILICRPRRLLLRLRCLGLGLAFGFGLGPRCLILAPILLGIPGGEDLVS